MSIFFNNRGSEVDRRNDLSSTIDLFKGKNRRIISLLHSLISLLQLLLLFSCAVSDPVKKNNKVFLSKYGAQVERKKKKHKEIAKEVGIDYKDTSRTDMMNTEQYSAGKGTIKTRMEIANSHDRNEVEEEVEPVYVGDDLSLYYKQRNLKDELDLLSDEYEIDEASRNLLYPLNNWADYRENRIDFENIKPTDDKLYGELKPREAGYTSIDSWILLINFDYLDIMFRVKREIALKNKENSANATDKPKSIKIDNSLVDRFKKIFQKN